MKIDTHTSQRNSHTSREEIPCQANISQFAWIAAARCRFCRDSHISLLSSSSSSSSSISSRIVKPADLAAAVERSVVVGLIGIFPLPKTAAGAREEEEEEEKGC